MEEGTSAFIAGTGWTLVGEQQVSGFGSINFVSAIDGRTKQISVGMTGGNDKIAIQGFYRPAGFGYNFLFRVYRNDRLVFIALRPATAEDINHVAIAKID